MQLLTIACVKQSPALSKSRAEGYVFPLKNSVSVNTARKNC